MQQLVGKSYTNTNKSRAPIQQENQDIKGYNPNQQEQDLLGKILQRYVDMKQKRDTFSGDWQLYQNMYENKMEPYTDGRTRASNFIDHATIAVFLSEMDRRPFLPAINSQTDNKDGENVLLEVWNYDHVEYQRGRQYRRDDQKCGIFGTSIMTSEYNYSTRIISDPIFEMGDIVSYDKKIEVTSEIDLKSIELKDFLLDNRAVDIESAVDCILILRKPYEYIKQLESNSGFKNIKSVTTRSGTLNTDVYTTTDDISKRDYVDLMVYYNKISDRQVIVANESIIIRDTPLLNAKHILPFSVRNCMEMPNQPYGRGFCELLKYAKTEITTLKETMIEAIKRSNNELIAIGGNLEFDGREFAYDNTILKFQGMMDGNLKQLSGTPPNSAIFNYMNSVLTNVPSETGIDFRNTTGSAKTAYETSVQEERASKIIESIVKNRNEAYTRLARLHLSNIMTHYPKKMVRGIVDSKDGKISPADSNYMKIKLNKKKLKGGKVYKNKEDSFFELTPDLIRGDYSIRVYTDLNQPTLRQQKKDLLNEGLAVIGNIEQLAQVSEEIQSNKDQLIDKVDDMYKLGLRDSGDKEQKKVLGDISDKVNAMSQSLGINKKINL